MKDAPDEAALRVEARGAWRDEVRRAVLPSAPQRTLALVIGAVGAFTLIAIGWRVARLFEGWAVGLVAGLGALLALALASGPWLVRRRLLQEGEARRVRASEERKSAGCPRCGAPVLARGRADAGARPCGRCGAILLEAEGLLIQHIAHARWRQQRWRSAARQRLEGRKPRAALVLSPSLWLGSTAFALGALWLVAAQGHASARAAVGGHPGARPTGRGASSARGDRADRRAARVRGLRQRRRRLGAPP